LQNITIIIIFNTITTWEKVKTTQQI